MRQLIIASAALAAMTAGATAQEVKIGVLMGFTGPTESLAPPMGDAAEQAILEASESGAFLGGSTVAAVRGDGTCIDASAATAAAERLITSDGVSAIMGATCSGTTTAVLNNVALPNGVVLISPSATSPALTTIEDDGLFFRTAPSDARQGQVLTDVLMDRGISSVALTYTNNDYGKGLADAFEGSYKAAGGEVTINIPHEDGKADYSAEVATLASAGGELVVVAGYLDQGGRGIIQAALDSGAFDTFVLPDGMVGDSLPAAIGSPLDGSFGTVPGTDSPGMARLVELGESAGFDGSSPYAAEAYDATALILLAMQAADSSDSTVFKSKVMDVANAPGEQIFPGEIAKGLQILADGGEIDYVGASDVELIEPGESAGNFREIEIKDGEITTVRYR